MTRPGARLPGAQADRPCHGPGHPPEAVAGPSAGPPSADRPAADLRLLLPALAAWAATSAVLGVGPRHHPWLLAAAAVLAVPAPVVLLRRRVRTARLHPAAPMLAAVLLTVAAATATTVLHTADLHRGPIPELARLPAAPVTSPEPVTSPTPVTPPIPDPLSAAPDTGAASSGTPAAVPDTTAARAELSVDLTVTGDPRTTAGRAGSATPGQDVLTLDAVVDRVHLPARPDPAPSAPGGAVVRTHTPVTVLVRARDVPAWQQLIPSVRVTADVLVGPPGDHDQESAALLTAHGPPRLLAQAGAAQRLAARLRTGLRRACDHLPADTRGLLPGLVVGDTSRLPADLREAFRATDLGHLTAVSGANFT